MRTTAVLSKQHIQHGYKVMWHIKRRRTVVDTGAEAVLAAKGIEVCDPKSVLTPPNWTHFEMPPKEEEKVEKHVRRDPRYVFHDEFSPPGGIAQAQHLTNTVVHSTLPQSVIDRVEDNSAEEDMQVQEAIKHCHVLDSYQEKLPRIYDVINRPGWSYPREYGMPVKRRNASMTYQLILLLEKLFPEASQRHLSENAKAQVNLKYSDVSFQMKTKASYLLSSSTPLAPPAGKEEVAATEELLIPDIYPISPFLNCRPKLLYSEEDFNSVGTSHLHPHTLFFHLNMIRTKHTEDTFTGVTLLKAFSHAAAYAKNYCKVKDGDLEKPLAVHVVHTNAQKYHMGVFQLNTLSLNSLRKNIFWHHPMEDLYKSCKFKVAKPQLEGYNPKVFSILKALHDQ